MFLDELGQEERDTTGWVQSEISSHLPRSLAVKSGRELALAVATAAGAEQNTGWLLPWECRDLAELLNLV